MRASAARPVRPLRGHLPPQGGGRTRRPYAARASTLKVHGTRRRCIGPKIATQARAWTARRLLIEPHQTDRGRAGWRARDRRGARNLCCHARGRAKTAAAGATTEVDPVLLEVFANLFMAIAEEMGATLQNTASSVNIKERLDFSCAIFDARRRAGGQCAAYAGASGLDGRLRDRDDGQASRRCATATCS